MTLFASLGRVFGGARRDFGVPSMHRPLALLTAVLVLALLGGSASGRSVRRLAPVGQNAVFVVTGHGWGHGVGMSQYGAYGYAQHGFPYTKIVVHYFPGTTLGPAPVSKVRVLLASGQSALKLTSADDFTVKDAGGTAHDISAGTYTLTPKLKVKLANAASAKPLTGPLTFQPGPSPLQLGSRHYRGAIQLDVVDGKLRAINVVGLEQYLYGVVPSEMPYTWAPEALKAQAVVARSYALASRRSGAFDLYPDTLLWYAVLPFVGMGVALTLVSLLRNRDEPTGLGYLAIFVCVYLAQYLAINLSYRQREDVLLLALAFVPAGARWVLARRPAQALYAAYWFVLAAVAAGHLIIRENG